MDYRSGPVQEFYQPEPAERQEEEEEIPPQQPPRPQQRQEEEEKVEEEEEEQPPPYPPRPQQRQEEEKEKEEEEEKPPPYPPRPEQQQIAEYHPPLPPRRIRQTFEDDDPSNPIHYTRDPHKLIAYLIPFPKPILKDTPPEKIPDRFIIYTPPPPPLSKPAEGEKEEKMHKVQRKWQEEVREAKTSTAKTTSWKGIKSKATRGIDWAVNQTTTSNLDFINRLGGGSSSSGSSSPKKKDPAASTTPTTDTHHDDGVHEDPTTKKTVGLTDMVIVYPPASASAAGGSSSETTTPPRDPEEAMRAEFVSSMLRTKTKAQRDAVLATGLLPVSFAVDVLATVVWPFGGLVEIDAVWMYSSIRGAKIARSTTKRLASSSSSSSGDGGNVEKGGEGEKAGEGDDDGEGKLKLSFVPSKRLDVLRRYLAARCHERDPKLFASAGGPSPTETEVLEAIGWAPSQTQGEKRNWEDEQWEVAEVKDDFRQVVAKAAREWDKWCKAFAKDPEKALKK
ncbi:hypothetical protein DIS24_g1806 [Lasiodiplodia hormozganensis]|uniref:Secreted protein n=1 Tax=Lasiodiplodia hormozganensis TaxID=869390 RepID=A0AA40D746_9PEZI|nr:hypothetical protein DIS24_g1806 [Lasiodiplodia hormozganensis]